MRKLCLCLFLVSVVLFTTKSSAYQASCGSKTYDTEFQICCNGVVSFVGYGNYQQCCGTKAYDPSLYRCCGGRVLLGTGWC
jgi:hypothetical protein